MSDYFKPARRKFGVASLVVACIAAGPARAEDGPREIVTRYMEALKQQQLAHMETSLNYCRKTLDLGVRWRT